MGNRMFENQPFDHWLSQKSQEILSKIDKEKFSTEDMLILTLKAQTNHFHHMDVEFRGEFKTIKQEFQEVNTKFQELDKRFQEVDKRFEQVDKRFEQVDKRFEQVDKRFEHVEMRFDKIDKKFENLTTLLTWGIGLILTAILTLKFFNH
jgi:predicted RNase H-like nuclease (RuvC/YqgF family)